MKRKSLRMLIGVIILATSLCGCNKNKEPDDVPVQQEQQEQRVPNLTNVEAGTVLDNGTLISYANSLAGRSDIESVACYTETESGVTSVTLTEGLHEIMIAYTTTSGETGETSLLYEATPSSTVSEEQTAVDEQVEEEVVEEEEVSIPIEGRIEFSISDGTESMTIEEFLSNEELSTGSMVNITDEDIASTLSVYTPVELTSLSISNKLKESDGGVEYDYGDDNYVVEIKNNCYDLEDGLIYFEVFSESANKPIYFAFKLSEEALADTEEAPEIYNDEIISMFESLENFYKVTWTYDPLVISEEEEYEDIDNVETEDVSSEIGEETVDETLTAMVGESYKSAHPELYIWPEPEVVFSRWDWRVTDSTSFKGVITLGDGSIIPEAQQQQDGYSYDFGNSSSLSSSSSSSSSSVTKPTTQQPEEDVITMTVGQKTFKLRENVIKKIKFNKDKTTDSEIVYNYNGSEYTVKAISEADWNSYIGTDYYGKNLPNFEVTLVASTEIGEGITKCTVQQRQVSFSDPTGYEEKRPYMNGIDCGNEYLIIVKSDGELPSRMSEAFNDIASFCIEPVPAE